MTQVSEQIQKILTKAKVQVANSRVVQDRNEKGHYIAGTRRTQLVLTGEGVEDPFKRTYFRKHRLANVQGARLLKVRKNSGEVVLEVAAAA